MAAIMLFKQLPGLADKRQALRVFVGARPLADKHQPRRWIAVAKDQLVAAFVQRAAGALADLVANELQCGGALGGWNCGCDCGGCGQGLAGRNGVILLEICWNWSFDPIPGLRSETWGTHVLVLRQIPARRLTAPAIAGSTGLR